MFYRVIHVAALLCAGLPALAQPVPALIAPRLVVAAPTEAPVVLRSVRVQTEISGRNALTAVELTFYNPNARQLEGELQFPLQAGQTVVGMAMDVNGVLREAVPIEKARGEAVFEDVTRTRIDPALLSLTQGDNYKLRVYPLMPRSEKVVVLCIAEWLAPHGRNVGYRLPLDYGQRLAAFTASVRVSGVASRPVVRVKGVALPEFAATGNGWRLDLSLQDATLQGALDIDLFPSTGGSVTTQRREGRDYFAAQLPVIAQSAPRALPRSVALVWDASGSGAQRDHGREFALLEAYFAKARNVEVQLVRVRDAAEAPQRFEVRGGDWRALRAALDAMVYDGATDLGAFVPDTAAQEVLLFSDGLSNFGARRFSAGKLPVYAVSAALRADAGRLRGIAEESGGRFIDLTRDAVPAAADALLRATTRVVAIESDGATQLVSGSIYPSDGALTLAGELTAPKTEVRVIVMQPDGRRQTLTLAVDATRDAGVLAAQAWARLKIASLEGEYAFHRAEIRRIGLAHAIVTRDTSLIILDRAQDYARHGVTPPSELAAEVAQLRERLRQGEQASAEAQLERVVKLFEAKQAWWAREFPKDAPKKTEVSKLGGAAEASGVLVRREPEAQSAPARMDERRARDSAPMPIAAPAPAMALAKSAGLPESSAPATTIRLRPAASDAPYLARLRAVPAGDMYRHYLDERAGYANSTAFILDVADLMFERGLSALATRVLSNLAEMDLENRQVLRILAGRLVQAGRADLAVPVLRQVLVLAPDEPQSHRDLGLALAAAKQPQAAVDALYEVARRQWPRFPEIELIALAEMNAIVATSATPLDTARIDPRLLKNLPLDLRATLSWDADNTDIDLWVTDPNGERAYYGNPLTAQGGRMSKDITSGYGPEEFSLKDAKPGKYTVQAQFYGHRQQIVSGATTIQLALSTGFGTAQAKQQGVTLRLKNRNDQVFVGEFEVQ
ncbi:MAG: VIT domain-containing protein [Burkholderiales bacterium]